MNKSHLYLPSLALSGGSHGRAQHCRRQISNFYSPRRPKVSLLLHLLHNLRNISDIVGKNKKETNSRLAKFASERGQPDRRYRFFSFPRVGAKIFVFPFFRSNIFDPPACACDTHTRGECAGSGARRWK